MHRNPARAGIVPVVTVVLMLAVAALTVGCGSPGSDTTSTTPASTVTSAAQGEAVLQVIVGGTTKSFTMDELKQLPATEGIGGIKNSAGNITPPVPCKGVSLESLLAQAGSVPAGSGVTIGAKDGYEMTMSLDQIQNGSFITYDVSTGDEKTVSEQPVPVIAYEVDGQPINPETEGPLRLVLINSTGDNVTDGHWWVKWVSKIEVKDLAEEWELKLEGTLTDVVDRATFESGTAPGCHGVSWKDESGQEWSGLPLYLLVGRVDDEEKHGPRAFNDDLAKQGYTIEIEAADGYVATLDSTSIVFNDEIIVADKVGGSALPDDSWPLRLVGSSLDKKQMVGQITCIRIVN